MRVAPAWRRGRTGRRRASVVTFGETLDADWRLEETEEGWRVTGPDDVAVPLRLQRAWET